MSSWITPDRVRPVLAAVLGLATAAPALAQSTALGLLENRVVISAGVFLVGSKLEAGLNGQAGENPVVDLDRTFGKSNDTQRARLDGLWRISPKHRVRFMYFDNSISRSAVLDEDVTWGDYLFKSGSEVTADARFHVGELAYEYAFVSDPHYEVTAAIGLHVTDLSLQLSGNADVLDANRNVTSSLSASKRGGLTAPLPVIGVQGGWAVAPQWYVYAQGQVFYLSSGDYKGNWSDLRLGATWMFSRNLGLGLGYDRFKSHLDTSKKGFDGRVRLDYSGLVAYLTGTF